VTAGKSKTVAAAAGTFTLGGDLTVNRLGFGAMRLTGTGVWGPPADPDESVRVLRRAIDLGVNFIDTADSYGPEVSEALIAEALHPYEYDLVIATKAGLTRQGPDQWLPVGRPEYLRQQCELSIRRLGVEAIDLFQLHRIDPGVPAEEQFGCLAELLAEGKVKAVGLSEVSVEQLRAALAIVPIATVQNLYNVTNRQSEALLDVCTAEGIGFIPWFPIAAGALAGPASAVADVAAACGATTAQVSLAWLLQRSPVVLPIPGTGSIPHLEENCGAGSVTLSTDQMERLSAIAA